MILVDTSVWVDHLRFGNAELVAALEGVQVGMHPWVVGELACGNLQSRASVLSLFQALPSLPVASDAEVLFFIGQQALMGRGLGYVDVHLLASARLAQSRLWTHDKRLRTVAEELGLAYLEARH